MITLYILILIIVFTTFIFKRENLDFSLNCDMIDKHSSEKMVHFPVVLPETLIYYSLDSLQARFKYEVAACVECRCT